MRTDVPTVNSSGFDRLVSSLPADSNARGEAFEGLCAWILRARYPEVKFVWKWHEWPGRPGRDVGIDLVALTHDGCLWAIQCKAVGSRRQIRKSEVDSFVSASATGQFSRRILMATTNRLSDNASTMLSNLSEPVEFLRRTDLARMNLQWPASLESLKPASPVKQDPAAHQHEAIDAVISEIREQGRARVTMACGTGKTLVGIQCAEAIDSELTVVFAPRLSLLAQLIEVWRDQCRTSFNRIAVCSDDSVNSDRDDDFRTRDLNTRSTTDAGLVAQFISGPGRKVIFATYQSARVVGDALATAGAQADLVVGDEAHRATGIAGRGGTVVVDNAIVPARRRLFMTATPRLVEVDPQIAEQQNVEVVSMDDESLFGKEVYKLSFGQAISRGLLSDYRVVVAVIDDSSVQKLIRDRRIVAIDGNRTSDAESIGIQVLVARAFEKWGVRSAISYFNRVLRASEFSSQVSGTAHWATNSIEIEAGHVNGTMSVDRRLAILERLSMGTDQQPTLVSNVSCLTEGIDIPAIDAVIVADPRRSTHDIAQIVGRALRRDESRPDKIATIVVPVFLPRGDIEQPLVADERFEVVWRVLEAMRSHDESLADEFDDLRLALDPHGARVELPSRVHLDVPLELDDYFASSLRAKMIRNVSATPQSQIRDGRVAPFHATPPTYVPYVDPWRDRSAQSAILDGVEVFVELHGHARVHELADFETVPEARKIFELLATIDLDYNGIPENLLDPALHDRFRELVKAVDLPVGAFPSLESTLSPFSSFWNVAMFEDGELEAELRRRPRLTDEMLEARWNWEETYGFLVKCLPVAPTETTMISALRLFKRLETHVATLTADLRRPFRNGFSETFERGVQSDTELLGRYSSKSGRQWPRIDAHQAGTEIARKWLGSQFDRAGAPIWEIVYYWAKDRGEFFPEPSKYVDVVAKLLASRKLRSTTSTIRVDRERHAA